MELLYDLPMGLYEKALPPVNSWKDIFSIVKKCGFSFLEFSVDESDMRIARLRWTKAERQQFVHAKWETNIRVPSMCLSAHRRYPFGSKDTSTRIEAWDIMRRAIDLADDIGIRTIQLAGYDVYYEATHDMAFEYFFEGMEKSVAYASQIQIPLAMEIMDTQFMSSVSRFLSFAERIRSPWFQVYPDVGNISAWNIYAVHELIAALSHTVAVHLKDTKKVTANSKGQFRDVPFGEGCVDFVSFFKALIDNNYQGPFLVEMWAEKDMNISVKRVVEAKEWILLKMKEAYDERL